jgi:hypothetical protein
MNRCPLCKRIYSADMSYCLEDGTSLEKGIYHLFDPQAPTLIVPGGRATPTENLRRHQLFLILRNKWLLIIVLTGVGIAAAVISQGEFIKSLLLNPQQSHINRTWHLYLVASLLWVVMKTTLLKTTLLETPLIMF